jgi:peptidoglycan glycosyltransferase
MVLRRVRLGFTAPQRYLELVLLVASAGFTIVAWRSLEASGVAMPATSGRILIQFLTTSFLGHLALRTFAPRAGATVYSICMMLSGIGLAFVTRLAPAVGQDQANWITLGVAGMSLVVVCSRLIPRLESYKYTAAFTAALVLVGTGLFGTTINGARLWVTVAGRTIQTTEIIKFLLVVFISSYLADVRKILSLPGYRLGGRRYSNLPYLIPLVLVWMGAMLALALLKDLGTIALLLLLAMTMLVVATGRLRFAGAGLVVLAATAAAGYVALPHVHDRIETWRDPFAVADDAGFQTVQSLYAFEAGGITGEGLGLGQPDAIPAVTTDYIFVAIGEELGLAGATAVVLLFVLLVFAGLQIAAALDDEFLRLLVCSAVLLLGIQAGVIIAGNLRLIPTTGITLPFVSYGGSSVVVNFALVGLVIGCGHAGVRERG